MGSNFEQLDQDEIFSFASQYAKDLNLSSNNLDHIYLKASEFIEVIERCLSVGGEAKTILFKEGLACEVLRFGANSWQKGKVRIKITAEFCSHVPEVKQAVVSNESEKDKSELLVDDLRLMIHQETHPENL